MTSKINSCSYDPNGGKNFNPINPVKPLRTDGALDIRDLVQEIVTKDFGYTGTSKYTLRLKNHKMVLELWDNASGTEKHKFAKIKLENDQWKRGATVLNDQKQTTNRLHHTLDRIRSAYNQGKPVERSHADGSAKLEATESTNRGPVINNYISCGHPVCNHSIEGLQGTLQQQLDELNRRVSDLERSIRNNQQPRPAQCREHVGKLEATVESLHEKLEKLQQSIDRLQRENSEMKGLRRPLEKISTDVPEALREISYELQQLRELLGERLSVNSSGAQGQMAREMQEGLSRMQAQLAPLEQEVAILKKANLDLQTENEALKRQAAAQAQKLSLKNREVEDLKAKNRDQEETLSRLQAELNQGKTKHSQLRDLFQEASAANQQVQIECRADNEALKGQLGKLQEAQQNSAQALSEKEREVEELQSELTASKEQNKEIEKLRQQLEQTNAKLAAAQQENVARQAEIDATKKAHLVGQEQLETLRVDLDRSLENQGRSVRELAQIHLEAEQLKSTLAKAEGKVEKLEAELTASRNRAEELERKNAAEKQRLEQELSKLRSQLELAEKTNATSQEKIEKLGESLVQKTKELEAQKRATESAQEAAKQAEHSLQEQKSLSQSETKRMQLELDRVEKAYEGVAENWKQSEKALAELKKTSRQKEEELNKQIALLDKHYAELTHQRTEELELHYALDTEQQQIITELEANLASLRLQNKDLEKIEQLQKELEGAKLQQKEAAQAKDSSDRLYKAQKKELKRRNKELEAELLRLKDKLTLNERMLKQQTASVPTEDLREKMPLPKTPITSSPKTIFLPVNNSNEMNQIDQTLQNIEQAMKTLDATETISPLWVGPIVINMAFLDGRLPGDRPTWISGKFEDELDAEELKRVDKSLTVHYEPLIARAYKEKNVHTVAGDLTKALRHEAIVALQKPDHFKTLESCFGEKLFIVKCLKEAKTQLKPIIAQYQTLGDKDPNRQSKFERASQLTVQIDQVLEVIGQKLNQHKWKIRA